MVNSTKKGRKLLSELDSAIPIPDCWFIDIASRFQVVIESGTRRFNVVDEELYKKNNFQFERYVP